MTLPPTPRIGTWCAGLALAAAAAALPAQAINNGTPTTDFQPVGFFGIQVAPDWVLTVQHVAGVFFPVSAGSSPYNNAYGDRAVIERHDAPGSGTYPANDLSLLRLAPGSGAGSSFYLTLSSDLYATGVMPALDVTITSAVNSGAARGYGHTTVTEFVDMLDPDDGGPEGPVTVNYLLSLDASIYVQGGDSGGGLFLGHVTDSTSPLLGLSSAQLGLEGQPPAGSGFVHLAAYRPWIDATLAAALNNSQQLQWVSAVPEPAAAWLWLSGAAALASALRQRRPDAPVRALL